MWEMQQLRARAGAVDVDLTSHRPGEMTLLSSSAQGSDELLVLLRSAPSPFASNAFPRAAFVFRCRDSVSSPMLVLPDPIGPVSALAYTRK